MCIKQQNNSLCSLGWMLSTCPKLAFHSGANTVFPYKIGQVHARGPVIIESCQFCYQLNKYVCVFYWPSTVGKDSFGKKHLSKLVILFLWCFVFSNDNFFLWKWTILWEWFVEYVPNPAQNTFCKPSMGQWDGMVHSGATHTPTDGSE